MCMVLYYMVLLLKHLVSVRHLAGDGGSGGGGTFSCRKRWSSLFGDLGQRISREARIMIGFSCFRRGFRGRRSGARGGPGGLRVFGGVRALGFVGAFPLATRTESDHGGRHVSSIPPTFTF